MNNGHASIDRAITRNVIAAGSALTIASLVAAVMLAASPREVAAKAEFSQQTGLPCGQCHSNPAGSGKLRAFGERFKANGYKVK